VEDWWNGDVERGEGFHVETSNLKSAQSIDEEPFARTADQRVV
jgi:hypothetical protein